MRGAALGPRFVRCWDDHILGAGLEMPNTATMVPGHNFIQVGLRGYLPDRGDLAWMREHGLRYHFMAEVEQHGWAAVMARAIGEALDGPEHVYLTIDIDVLDPAYAAAVGTPEPGGLTPRELFPLIRNLCARTKVVGVQVVEMNPRPRPELPHRAASGPPPQPASLPTAKRPPKPCRYTTPSLRSHDVVERH